MAETDGQVYVDALERPEPQPLIEIHTSDRINYRRCRRRWNWSSPLRENLRPIGKIPSPLWFGTGIHFALEDYHSWREYPHPIDAFNAYVGAHRQSELPEDFEELVPMAHGMLDYYVRYWEPRHLSHYQTLWLDDLPGVEVEFNLRVPGHPPEVRYLGKLDRLVRDPYDRVWVVDYKTAQRFDTGKLETDPQVSAYVWAANQILGHPVEGVIYIQLLKDIPHGPRQLANGEFSQARNQRTSYALYRDALLRTFGEVPRRYVDFLNELAAQEGEHGDKYIRIDHIRRNRNWVKAEEWKIYYEVREMLDEHLPLYPNPTRDCAWDCPFRAPCLAMDDGADWEFMLRTEFAPAAEANRWKERIDYAPWKTATVSHQSD